MTARTGLLRQDNRVGIPTAVERGYLGQDIQLRKDNRDGTTVPVERGQVGYDIWDMTSGRGPLRQDSLDRTSKTGQLDRTVGTGQSQDKTISTGQPDRSA
jgi:hypothetical protein